MSIELISILSTLITLSFLFALTYYFWQNYVIDVTRQQLFELRNEAFDMATCGELDRKSDAYQIVREMFNSSIRFTHKTNFPNILFVLTIMKYYKKISVQSNAEKVNEIINKIEDKETKEKLLYLLRQMHLILVSNMIKRSPVMLVIVIIAILVNISVGSYQNMRDKFGNALNGITYSDAIKHEHSIS